MFPHYCPSDTLTLVDIGVLACCWAVCRWEGILGLLLLLLYIDWNDLLASESKPLHHDIYLSACMYIQFRAFVLSELFLVGTFCRFHASQFGLILRGRERESYVSKNCRTAALIPQTPPRPSKANFFILPRLR